LLKGCHVWCSDKEGARHNVVDEGGYLYKCGSTTLTLAQTKDGRLPEPAKRRAFKTLRPKKKTAAQATQKRRDEKKSKKTSKKG
jgi:hypothetical protein